MELQRYYLRLVIRDEAEYRGGKEVKHHCTSTSPVAARRSALERAWANGCLVTRFTEVKSRAL